MSAPFNSTGARFGRLGSETKPWVRVCHFGSALALILGTGVGAGAGDADMDRGAIAQRVVDELRRVANARIFGLC